MAIRLPKEFAFNVNPKLLLVEPKALDPDRMLTNLFMRLDHDGKEATALDARRVDRNRVRARIEASPHLQGFFADERAGIITYEWLKSDLFIIQTLRDKTLEDRRKREGPLVEREQLAALRPLHLSSYHLRNRDQTNDNGSSAQLYSMISPEPALLQELRNYLNAESRADQGLDVATMMAIHLAEDEKVATRPAATSEPAVLEGQAHLLREDIWRLLAYCNVVPRQVLIEMLRTITSVHLGLYLLHLIVALPQWLRQGKIAGEGELRLAVDLGEDHRSAMAAIARASFSHHTAQLTDYTRAMIIFRQLLTYGQTRRNRSRPKLDNPRAEDVIALINERESAEFVTYFSFLEEKLRDWYKEDVGVGRELDPIRQSSLDELDQLVEMICYARLSSYRDFTIRLLNATLLKNSDSGLLRSQMGRWPTGQSRFWMGSRLLETLVHLAVLEGEAGSYQVVPRPLDWFIDEWLAKRYGIYINPLDVGFSTSAAYPAYRDNFDALRSRLQSIGFYSNLSDASTAQTIIPRYDLRQVH